MSPEYVAALRAWGLLEHDFDYPFDWMRRDKHPADLTKFIKLGMLLDLERSQRQRDPDEV